MKTKPNTAKPVVTQTITLTIKGQAIELSKEEALEIAAELDKATGRKLPVPAPVIIEKEIYRDRQWTQPHWSPTIPTHWEYPTVICDARPDLGRSMTQIHARLQG